jgi:hypothetical protein
MMLLLHITVPYMMNEMKTDMGAYFGFIYGPFCIVAIVWAYFRLPELKGMSFLE